MTKILFVINPIAGDIDKDELVEDVQAFCRKQDLQVAFFHTSGQQDEVHLQEMINEFNPAVVTAVGGDGTVSLVAKMIIDTEIALAIIPQGSGNGLSKDLEIPQAFDEALYLLKEHRVQAIDTLLVNNQLSIHLCDMGFNALVVKKFCEGETRGPGAYAWIAMQEYIAYEPKQYTVTSEGKVLFDGEAFMITVTNAKAFGSNMVVNPNFEITDGQFEICIIEPFPKTSSLALLYRMYTESIEESVFTQRFSCRKATIVNSACELAQIDGEPVSLPEQVEFEVLPGKLKVLLPAPEGAETGE